MAFHRIVKTRQPKSSGFTLKSDACISENGDAAGGERFGYCMRADDDIVVAEDCVALGALEAFEDARAFPCVGYGPFTRQQFVGHEIAGEKNRIGAQAVDVVDGFPEKEWLGELVEMNVTELDDMEAVEGLGKIAQPNFGVGDFNDVASNFAGIERQTCGTGEACCEEASTGERKSRMKA